MYTRYSREVDRVRETDKTSIPEEKPAQKQVIVNGENLQAVVDEELQRLWERLQNPPPEVHANPNCLLKKHLTPELYEQLKLKKTRFGGTLKDCIRSGELIILLVLLLILRNPLWFRLLFVCAGLCICVCRFCFRNGIGYVFLMNRMSCSVDLVETFVLDRFLASVVSGYVFEC